MRQSDDSRQLNFAAGDIRVSNDDVALKLNDWRQGDVIVGTIELPVLDQGDDGEEISVFQTEGGLLLTQSCDIVRDYNHKPFLHVAALVVVDEEALRRIKAGREIRYLFVPGLADQSIVADLDKIATIDKRVVMNRERRAGCFSDDERRGLAASIARHRQRFAFPDEFNDALKPLRRLVENGAGKNSDNGRFVDAVLEIRVTTSSWDNPTELDFICIIPEDTPQTMRELWVKDQIPRLEDKASTEWCRDCNFRLSTLSEMSAAEYLESNRLDFDGLSDA